MIKTRRTLLPVLFAVALCACGSQDPAIEVDGHLVQIAQNPRYFSLANGDPFFWMGDTAWHLFRKLTREEVEAYLENRRQKGFNVIQAVAVFNVRSSTNMHGDSALVGGQLSTPLVTPGNDPADSAQYDYWDHVDYVVDLAASKGLYVALLPLWGSNVTSGLVTQSSEMQVYGQWLANRYKDRPNIIWVNGGDTDGSRALDLWNALATALRQTDPSHVISFHPYGRMQSSDWFHQQAWLDFNMFQSGHRTYAQDDTARHYGEDNWRYVVADYQLQPVKPTLDAEPSYEGIPQGLHDPSQPYWTDRDVRRYAYWSVFAGACGFTYGHNAVMQFYRPGDKYPSYGAKEYWTTALDNPGAGQMLHLTRLMLSRSYFDRVPDQSLIASNQGERYDYLIATRGQRYAFVYTYTGRTMEIAMGKIAGAQVRASWLDPRTGASTDIGTLRNDAGSVLIFDPPGEKQDGNDWVLVLDSV